jgi:hypothetical protein
MAGAKWPARNGRREKAKLNLAAFHPYIEPPEADEAAGEQRNIPVNIWRRVRPS